MTRLGSLQASLPLRFAVTTFTSNLLWGLGFAFLPLIPVVIRVRYGIDAWIASFVLGIIFSSLASIVAGYLTKYAKLIVVTSYLVSALGVAIIAYSFHPLLAILGYIIYSLNGVGWVPLAYTTATLFKDYKGFWLVILLSTSVRLGALIGSSTSPILVKSSGEGLNLCILFFMLSSLVSLAIPIKPPKEERKSITMGTIKLR